MEHDHHEGQRVSRRTALAGFGSIGLGALLAACSGTESTGAGAAVPSSSATTASTDDLAALFAGAGTCTLTPGTTQGPYYFDADRIRSDIREDRPGTRLRLAVRVQDSEACGPLPDAVVEIWHCDAAGLYSGAESLSSGGGGGGGPGGSAPPSGAPTGAPPSDGGAGGGAAGGGAGGDLTPQDDKRYLRGAQVTDADGIVRFTTVWPGWYVGRTVHIHAMVHIDNDRTLTTQLMMDETLNSKVFAQAPYSGHTGRDTFNQGDSIYRDAMLLKVTEDGDGYLGVITFGVDPDHDGS
ncbi:protocatechuate dioxygenase [Kitasatospora sp. NPDC002040]|uniref:dioxygenase family protein n=1 Tax=Kitasatospora sp. NPDC002040 TaxID=3154661 RepID=UPI003321332E